MDMRIKLSGQRPEGWEKAFGELAEDLGMVLDPEGVPVEAVKGEALAVESDGAKVKIVWGEPVQFYRALSLIPLPLAPCSIHESPCFQSVGPMFDVSRNAVLKPEALRFFLRKAALMGLNLCMLYTEDTYEVPEQPYFGYKRGRYTYEELKALDDYAAMLGIELCPCIQVLGHLNRALRWPSMRHLRDNGEVLLADQEETYAFIEQLLRAASAPYRSKRIHIGMDEAYGVGLGEHLRRFGYEDPRAVIGRHLTKVLDIAEKLGLHAMMWSDMYFHLDGRDYHSEGMPSQKAIDAVDPRVTLVYWDYYHAKEEEYAAALKRHAAFHVPTVFAGGVWTWSGPAPVYENAVGNTVPALEACKKAGVPLVLATAWGDDGGECNFLTSLLGLQLYGEFTYTGVYEKAALYARFRRCCGADAQAFEDLGLLNKVPGMLGRPADPVNACKILLYQDPLVQLFEKDMEGFPLSEHYSALVPKYEQYAKETPSYRELFRFYAALSKTLSVKCVWHQQAAAAVRSGNRAEAAVLADAARETACQMETLRFHWRKLWEETYKPYGFEIIDARLGGAAARMATARDKMQEFADGLTGDIPELTSPVLPFRRYDGDHIHCTNTMDEIVSACKIDF